MHAHSVGSPIGTSRTLITQAPETGSCSPSSTFSKLVEEVRHGCDTATGELYGLVNRTATAYLRWKLGYADEADIQDRSHNAFIATVEAIQSRELREPERLPGFIRTVVRRQAVQAVRASARRRLQCEADALVAREPGQEGELIASQQRALVRRILCSLKKRDREILVRFYLEGQRKERICAEMGLSETQFRLLKWRAKARLTELVSGKLASRCGRSAHPATDQTQAEGEAEFELVHGSGSDTALQGAGETREGLV